MAVEPTVHTEEDEDANEAEDAKQEVRSAEEALREELRRAATPSSASPLSDETQAAEWLPGDEIPLKKKENEEVVVEEGKEDVVPGGPLETVLEMPAPESAEELNAQRPPHLQMPPYVHHFDTYTLVSQVQGGGFTTDQAVTSMKAVRGLLALNLDVAKAGLVSKSDVENVSNILTT